MSTKPPLRRTPKYMTKYERARILGVRAIQISLGAPIMVVLKDSGIIDPLTIALQELKVLNILSHRSYGLFFVGASHSYQNSSFFT